MGKRRSEILVIVAVVAGAAVLSAFAFVGFFAPGWPRTIWGWLISAALGLPLLLLAEVIFTLCFTVGPPRYRRYSLAGTIFRVPAGTAPARGVLLIIRILIALTLCGAVLWLLYTVLGIGVVRAQFQ